MKNRKEIIILLSLILFIAGVLTGTAFFGFTVWGDYEAAMFDASLGGDKRFTTLRCPILINSNETGTVSVTVENPTENSVERLINTSKSGGFVTSIIRESQRISLGPGEKQQLQWTVSQEDAAWGHFILNRVYLVRLHPQPSRSGSCGVLTADLGIFTGGQIVAIVFVTSLALMIAGWFTWLRNNRPFSERNRIAAQAMGWLAGVVLAGMISGLFGWWVLGAFLLVAAVLLMVVIVGGDPVPPLVRAGG
jgi:hypothetical protein